MPLVIKLLASGLLVAGVLALAASPSSAVPAVDRADRRGDVDVVSSGGGVEPAVAGSVDIRHLTVTHHREGLRVVVRLARVLPVRSDWTQELIFVAGTDLDQVDDAAIMQTFVDLQHVGGSVAYLASLSDPGSTDGPEQEPPHCHVGVTKAAHRVRLDIPSRCVAGGDGPVIVALAVSDRRDLNDPFFAEDQLSVGLPFAVGALRRALDSPVS